MRAYSGTAEMQQFQSSDAVGNIRRFRAGKREIAGEVRQTRQDMAGVSNRHCLLRGLLGMMILSPSTGQENAIG